MPFCVNSLAFIPNLSDFFLERKTKIIIFEKTRRIGQVQLRLGSPLFCALYVAINISISYLNILSDVFFNKRFRHGGKAFTVKAS